MAEFGQDVFSIMRAAYNDMTPVERTIAGFFLNEKPQGDLSLQSITKKIFVSEASLSRFAQRCGYIGFREFIYQYRRDAKFVSEGTQYTPSTQAVLNRYQELYAKSLQLINEDQINRIVSMMRQSKMIHVYGDGLSGYAAREFKARFMRLGLSVESFTDDFMMMTNSTLIQPDTLAIGMSISGKTKNTLNSLRNARENGAKTLLMTGHLTKTFKKEFDEVFAVATYDNLNTGINTSPLFPFLIMADLLFSHYMHINLIQNTEIYYTTQRALSHNCKE